MEATKSIEKEILNIINNCYSKTSYYYPGREFFIYDEDLIRKIKLAKINNDTSKIKIDSNNINIFYEINENNKKIWISFEFIKIAGLIYDKIETDESISEYITILLNKIYSKKYEIKFFIKYEKEIFETIKQSMNYNIKWKNVDIIYD